MIMDIYTMEYSKKKLYNCLKIGVLKNYFFQMIKNYKNKK
jgi:hypothetical protein